MSSTNGVKSLVNFLGDDKLKVQVVHNSLVGKMTLSKDGVTKFTMVTEEENLTPGDMLRGSPRKIGVLLWVDAADYQSWVDSP